MSRKMSRKKGFLLLLLLCSALWFLGSFSCILMDVFSRQAAAPSSERPDQERNYNNAAANAVPEELRHILLLEELQEEEGQHVIDNLLELSRRLDAVGYHASLELARRHSKKGEVEESTDHFRQALSLYGSPEVQMELAAYLKEEGLLAQSIEEYYRLLPAEEAVESLIQMGEEHCTVAGALLEKRLWKDAAGFLRPLIDTAGTSPCLERYYIMALVELREHEEALQRAEKYRAANPSDPEMEWYYGRCLELKERKEEALEAYRAAGKRGSYRRGIILEQLGRLQEAAAAFCEAPEAEARWRGARLWETLGNVPESLETCLQLAAEESPVQDDAAYRAYLLLAGSGDPRREELLEVLSDSPAWMKRLGKEPHWEIFPELPSVEAGFIKRAETYRQSGRTEMYELELAIGSALASTQETIALGRWYREQGHYYLAVRQGIKALRERPCRRAYRLAYPYPYRDLVREAADRYGLDDYILLAVMREESHFRQEVVSHAGARGLMQIMPATGEDIASSMGLQFQPADLFDPEINIRFGAWYLRSMLNMFDGNLDMALAAYNAGPGHASRWRQSPLGKDPATFPAAVSFIETRQYITKVMDSYLTYQWLYDGT